MKLNLINLEVAERKQVANELLEYLSRYFLRPFHLDEQQLQDEFVAFSKQKYYKKLIRQFEKDHDVTIGKSLNADRFKLCEECGRPFISVDRRNRSKVCDREIYVRYTLDGKQYNNNCRSLCWVKRNRKQSLRHLHEVNLNA